MNILIAVPGSIISSLIARILRASMDVSLIGEATNAEVAAQQWLETTWQLVILGLGLETGGGLRFLKRFKADRPSVPVLMVSHYAYRQGVELCLTRGAHGFVLYSELGEELLPSVRAALAGEVYLSEVLTQLVESGDNIDRGGAMNPAGWL